MLRTTKNMKDKYEKIQSILFSLIPEKWESIHLYASVIVAEGNSESGEMFFYYVPKGLLKKKPINVYEVPERFNINEEQYLKTVKKLYNCIKDLRQDFIDTEQDLWTNITISIANMKFRVEYNYNKLPIDEKESEERRAFWLYKYLNIGGENKKEQSILEKYSAEKPKRKSEIYEVGLYMKTENSSVGFDREGFSDTPKEVVVYEKENNNESSKSEKEEIRPEEKNSNKNQILNM